MKNSAIQWCDHTVNPVMGCDGCELYPVSVAIIREALKEYLSEIIEDYEN